jgi:hypothetical protein
MLLRIILVSCFVLCTFAYAEDKFTPRLAIDHKAHIDEALQYLRKQRPAVKPENLAFSYMSYQYQMMDGTTSVCGPEGCRIVPAAPFQETLSIAFTVLDSKRLVTNADGDFIEYDSLVVQFPTPRMPEWHILEGKSSSQAPASKEK